MWDSIPGPQQTLNQQSHPGVLQPIFFFFFNTQGFLTLISAVLLVIFFYKVFCLWSLNSSS